MKKFLLSNYLLGGLFFIFCGWMFASKNLFLDLHKVDQIEGRVTRCIIASTYTKKYGLKRKIFKFKLDTYPYPFKAFRSSQDYSNLTNKIGFGDYIKVYYKKWKTDNYVKDIYQIEKNGKILLDYNSYQSGFIILIGFLFLVGIFLIVYGVRKFKEH